MLNYTFKERPSSYPYISGDAFRSLCDHIYEDPPDKEYAYSRGEQWPGIAAEFNPAAVNYLDRVFVKTHYLQQFFEHVHKKISHPYCLITHNSDIPIDASLIRHMDDKIAFWYAKNVLVEQERLIPIPIGIENAHYQQVGLGDYLAMYQNNISAKANKILFGGYRVDTNPLVREHALEKARELPHGREIKQRLPKEQYLKLLSGFKFIISPEGHGVDCFRTWEAMYLEVVPVVQRSPVTMHFDRLNLPIWIIDDWETLKEFDEDALASQYEFIMRKTQGKAMYMDYWKELIEMNSLSFRIIKSDLPV